MGVTIELHIDELAFTGFDRLNTDLLVQAFERELTRLLHRHDLALEHRHDLALEHRDVVAGLPPLPHTTSARSLGVALARSVHGGLVREAP
jgi:hypothetical protein